MRVREELEFVLELRNGINDSSENYGEGNVGLLERDGLEKEVPKRLFVGYVELLLRRGRWKPRG